MASKVTFAGKIAQIHQKLHFSSIFHVSFRWIVKSKLFEIWKSCKWMFYSKLFELFKNQHLGNICCLCCFCGLHLWTGKAPFLLKMHENQRDPRHSKSLRNASTCYWSLEMCSGWSNSTFMSQGNISIKSFFRSKNSFKSHSYKENCYFWRF